MSAVRTVQCPLGFYQDLEASGSETQRVWNTARDIPGRYIGDSKQPKTISRPHLCSNLHTGESGLYGSPREVNDPTLPEGGVSGNDYRFDLDGTSGSLPQDKKIRAEALQASNISAREVSHLIRKMTSVTQAIPPAPLFYRNLQREVSWALARNNQSYDVPCHLSLEGKEELQWWIDHLSDWNGKSLIRSQRPDVVIESDASLRGWGVTSNGVNTGGPWNAQEKGWHINCLEIQAASLVVQTFVKNQTNVVVLLLLDNTTAVSYINHLGGTVSPQATSLVKELWLWCLRQSISLKAHHLPGKENVIADHESRVMKDRSDWMLNPIAFNRIAKLQVMEIDLFASSLTSQLPDYFSWRPDPLAIATDAFLQDWLNMKAYANPPWNLIGRVLAKLQQHQDTQMILITPLWPSQSWYPVLLDLLIDPPRLLPEMEDLMLQTWEGTLPEVIPQLVAWPNSNNHTQHKRFQNQLHDSCCRHGGRNRPNHTTHYLWRWVSWCEERNTDPITSPVNELVNFLADLHGKGYSYGSLNAYRSAISSTHDRVDGMSIGQHPLVCRLLTGVFNSNPPQPRYTSTWDVSVVVSYLKSLPSNSTLPLKSLTLKTVMLMALTRPSRSADLCMLSIDQYRLTPESLSFIPTGLTKQSRVSNITNEIFFNRFTEDESICPVTTTLQYIRRTESLRLPSTMDKQMKLFISWIKPHHSVTSSSIARWLKTILKQAGIDTSIFKAHSTRGASVSAAKNMGVTSREILDTANWSTESVFQRFYYKPVRSSNFSDAILKGQS